MSLGWPFNIIYSWVIWYNFAVAKNDRSWAPANDAIVTSSVKFWELKNKISSSNSVASFLKGFAPSVQEIIAAIFIFLALRLPDRSLFRLYQSIMINLRPSSSYILDSSCSIAPADKTNHSLIMVTGWYKSTNLEGLSNRRLKSDFYHDKKVSIWGHCQTWPRYQYSLTRKNFITGGNRLIGYTLKDPFCEMFGLKFLQSKKFDSTEIFELENVQYWVVMSTIPVRWVRNLSSQIVQVYYHAKEDSNIMSWTVQTSLIKNWKCWTTTLHQF